MAPSPPSIHISTVDSASKLFQRLDLLDKHYLPPKKMDCLDIDQIMDVPDTPDRLVPQGGNSENGNLSNRRFLGDAAGNHTSASDCVTNARTYPSYQREHDVHDQFDSGHSLFALSSNNAPSRVSSSKSTRLADRVPKQSGTNLFAQTQRRESMLDQKKFPFRVTSNSHCSTGHVPDAIKLGSGSSDISRTLVPGIKIQSGNRGKVVSSSDKVTTNILDPSRGRERRKVLLGQKNYDSTKGQVAESPQSLFIQDDDDDDDDGDHFMNVDAIPKNAKRTGSASFDKPGNHLPKERGRVMSFPGVSVRDTHRHNNNANPFEYSGTAHKRELDATVNGTSVNVYPVAKVNSGNKGKEIHLRHDSQSKTEPGPLQNVISPPRTGQRRLVRNGRISPFNIAKSQGSLNNYHQISTSDKQNANGKVECNHFSGGVFSNLIHIISPGSEGNQTDRMKGKELVVDNMHANEYVDGTRSSSRDFIEPREGDVGTEDATCSAEEIGSWRSTHNHSKKTQIPLSCKKSNNGCSSNDWDQESGTEDKDQVMVINDDSPIDLVRDPVSSQLAIPNQHQVQVSSSIISEYDPEKDRTRGKQKLMKRKRKVCSVRNQLGECSSSTSVDPGVLCFPNTQAARTVSSQRHSILEPVIEVDDRSSPEARCGNPQVTLVNYSDEKAKQVEADEMLARQLQEQFYQEVTGTGAGEIDLSIAMAIQPEEDTRHFPSVDSPRLFPRRNLSSRNPYAQYRSQLTQNPHARLTNRVRRSTSARMAQLRRNFHSRPSVASSTSRGPTFRFPPNMDVDMRLDILEALEAAVGTGTSMTVGNPFFNIQRDFNENDYEMLLALDEDNRHVDASENQINNLPESIVQTDDFGEVCAICLETPSSGDTIRHLPCLHKFHKECIDPWLRRKTSCPVCKSSIR